MASSSPHNPLINWPSLPHGAPPLDSVQTEHFLPAVQNAIAEAKEQIEKIKNNPQPATFENTIEALEFSGRSLGRVTSVFSNLSGANSNDDLRAIEKDINLACTKHGNDIMLDAKLFQRIKEVHDVRKSLNLTPEQEMLLNETYKGFVRSGALLSPEDKDKLRAISEKMSAVKTTYRNNIVKSMDAFAKLITDEDELKGLPDRVKSMYREMAEEAGHKTGWLIKLSPPPIDLLTYCENRALREEISRANSSVAYKDAFDNRDNVMEIVRLRQQAAQLMGYDNHAAFVLSDRMAKTPQTVMDFLKENEKNYRPAAEEYLKKVKDYAAKTDGITDFKPWDFALYSRRLQEETFQMDMESVRPYFDLEKVMEGLRHHAEHLFNIELREEKSGKYPVYHQDVKTFEVFDKKTGDMIGLFYGDFYARPGCKSPGAWMSTFRDRGLGENGNEFAIVTNVCNFAKPTADHPTLLSVDEVRTVFHEFGHALHALLARGNYPSLTGTNVKWDWVELPSQLQENWAKSKETLDTFARHHKTGELLPAELITKIQQMDNFDAGYVGLRQTFMGLLDMKWHTTDPAKINSIEDLEDDLIAQTWLFPRMAGPVSTSFGHIFAGGYSAGYYSYKWAEVLEADVFEEFMRKGLYDRATGDRLRDTIYAQGGMVDPSDLFVQMMGRQPDAQALFRREGLLPPLNDNGGPASDLKNKA
jgi:peptidyl-dipeptidase Dcp